MSENKNTALETELGCYRVKLLNSSETQVLCGAINEYSQGDKVIVQSKYGRDLAKILTVLDSKPKGDDSQKVLRKATSKELERFRENQDREEEALKICREKVAARGLDMKLVAAHYLLDEPKVLFFFTAESRVDFRELVKDLVAVFRMRIELRQIGVRDESRILGGLAVCGRQYCCHGITDKLRSVSIKMVKEQNLSLNSMKISGPCGRLLCCLAYEYDFYNEIKKTLPSTGTRLRFGNEEFRVREINALTQKMIISTSDGRTFEVSREQIDYSKETQKWNLINFDPEE